ncbi:MAG TPA: ACT domain-containing protein, partial [Thiolinea sp.]|nr:ACT domain-containing protein [Thiolinea sp.]
AGAEPTASAVVADIVDVVRAMTADPNNRVPHLAFQPSRLADTPILPIDAVETAFYLRMRANDRPGVLADITRILGDRGISIESLIQKDPELVDQDVDIIMLTQRVREGNMNEAVRAIEALDSICGRVTRIRVESLG